MSFAKNTPIQYLPGIGWRTANVLNDLGIHTAGQLRNVPDALLIELFGPSFKPVLRNISVDQSANLAQSESKRFAYSGARTTVSPRRKTFGERLRLAAQLVHAL